MEWDPGRSQPTRPPGCPQMFAREYHGISDIHDESHVIFMHAALAPSVQVSHVSLDSPWTPLIVAASNSATLHIIRESCILTIDCTV